MFSFFRDSNESQIAGLAPNPRLLFIAETGGDPSFPTVSVRFRTRGRSAGRSSIGITPSIIIRGSVFTLLTAFTIG